jgi:hypothetical protein
MTDIVKFIEQAAEDPAFLRDVSYGNGLDSDPNATISSYGRIAELLQARMSHAGSGGCPAAFGKWILGSDGGASNPNS